MAMCRAWAGPRGPGPWARPMGPAHGPRSMGPAHGLKLTLFFNILIRACIIVCDQNTSLKTLTLFCICYTILRICCTFLSKCYLHYFYDFAFCLHYYERFVHDLELFCIVCALLLYSCKRFVTYVD